MNEVKYLWLTAETDSLSVEHQRQTCSMVNYGGGTVECNSAARLFKSSRSPVVHYCIHCLLFAVQLSPETVSAQRKSLIQLIHLRPSSPPLFICPFSAFSPYLLPSFPPLLSLDLSLSFFPLTSCSPRLHRCLALQTGPARLPAPRPCAVPQVNQRRPGHTLARKGPGSPYGLPEKGPFSNTKYITAPLRTKGPGSRGTRPPFRALSVLPESETWTELKSRD